MLCDRCSLFRLELKVMLYLVSETAVIYIGHILPKVTKRNVQPIVTVAIVENVTMFGCDEKRAGL